MDKFWYNNEPTTRFIEVDNKNYIPFTKKELQCEQCGNIVKKEAGRWVSQCEVCKAIISFFMPTPIQQIAGICESSIMINLGGYGSGKTTISCNILSSMMRRISGARSICFAQTEKQLKQNAISELKQFFHPSEILKKTDDKWELVNGGVIEFWPSDNADKLRSANANFIWLVEANSRKMQLIFNESLARIRNEKGYIYETDEDNNVVYYRAATGELRPKIKDVMNMIIVEANPDDNAWTNRIVFNAHTIIHTPTVANIGLLKNQVKPIREPNIFNNELANVDITVVMNATVDNPILPDNYFINLKARCRNQYEYDKIVYCDITCKEGLVFRDLVDKPTNYFKPIQQPVYGMDMLYIEGLDPGGSNIDNDPEGYLLCQFDRSNRKLYIIAEHKVSGLNMGESLTSIQRIRTKWGWRRDKELFFVADNALGKKYKVNSSYSLKSDYEIGLATSITLCNDKAIDAGIQKVLEWFDAGAIVIGDGLEHLRAELFNYAINLVEKVDKANGKVYTSKAYSEKDNHLIDVLRYIIVTLESMGFNQHQHQIDFAQQAAYKQQVSRENVYIGTKFDIRSYLPGGKYDEPLPVNKKVYKF